MSETYPLRAKAIGRSWALELVLRITGIGPIGLMQDPVLRRTERGVPLARRSPVRHKKVLLLRAP